MDAPLIAAELLAGMPSYDLTDLARTRLEVISFFIVMYLVFTLVVKFLWNLLSREIPSLPVLSYKGALALMLLSGLLLYVVLTMISGARELMTPGAWERSGATYKLRQEAEITPVERLASLQALKSALWNHREAHGSFPESMLDERVPVEFWRVGGHLYDWRPAATNRQVLVSEPAALAPPRWSLLADGSFINDSESP